MNLDHATRAILDERGVRHILIGAVALGIYGLVRSTHDTDFFTVDRSVLNQAMWASLETEGTTVSVLKGDYGDPLVGTVRIVHRPEQVDVVVGKWKWEAAVIERAEEHMIAGAPLRVPRPADLVLLKLAAGGPKDMWDIHALMDHIDRGSVIREIDSLTETLPTFLQKEWTRMRAELS